MFYRWVVLGAAFLVLMNYGLFYSYGVFFKPLIEEFGWSRAQTSLAFSFYVAIYSASGIPMGWLYDRYGPRLPLLLTALLIGTGFAALSQVSALWMLYLFFGLVAGLGHGASWVVSVSTVMGWFDRHRGTAVGIVTGGMGVGTLIFPPLAHRLVASVGWRETFFAVGVVAFSYNLLAALLLRPNPASRGLPPSPTAGPAGADPAPSHQSTLPEPIRTYSFWSVYAAVTLAFAAYSLLLVHLMPYATDRGMDPGQAAGAVALMGVGALTGRMGLGVISDHIGRTWTLRLAYGANALAFAGLLVTSELGWLYAIALSVGFFGMGGSVVLGPLLREFFGERYLGKLLGTFMTCGIVSGFLGPYFTGYLFDLTGNYSLAFGVATGIAVGAALLTFLIHPPRRKNP